MKNPDRRTTKAIDPAGRETNCLPAIFILSLLCFFYGCATVPLPQLKPLLDPDFATKTDLLRELEQGRPPTHHSSVALTPLPARPQLIPPVGKNNVYGISVTPELKLAYETYLGGNAEQAFKALEQAESKSSDPGMLWQISFLKAQVLIMMGRAADAEVELETTSKREMTFIGHNWNSRALRGEVRLWLEDYENAKQDLFQVVKAAGDWSMPTSYALPPGNLPELVGVVTAQLRAFTALAGIYLFEGKYDKALLWAETAEKKFNDVHFLTQHPLYGRMVVAHADSFYGRANNLVFLAAAKLAVTRDVEESNIIFNRADSFFRSLDYDRGIVTLEALRARTLHEIKQYALANAAAIKALELARRCGATDMIWRIEVLRGQTLFEMGYEEEAEQVFRHAQTGIDEISGTLATDRAKLRFGVGKEDVVHFLTKLDVKKLDYTRLFEDLERSRARAFVEMLAGRNIAPTREPELVKSIQQLGRQILQQRLANYAPGNAPGKNLSREKELLSQRQAVIERLRQRDPEIADVLSISFKSLRQIQSRLKSGDVLVYALPSRSHESVQLFLIEEQNQKILTLSLTWNALQNLLDQFTDSIGLSVNQAARGIAIKVVSPVASSISSTDAILKDLFDGLKISQWQARRTIYLVPSGALYFVPWGALDIQAPVVILPNGGWLIRNPRSIVAQFSASIVGDPELGGVLPQLPGAREEARSVAAIYQVAPLLGEDATEKKLRDSIGAGVKVLHLATHGIFDPKDPLASALYLSKERKAFSLTANALYENPIPAQTVIMSACATGMGKIMSGDDLLGLSRSLYLGGATAILSSLWPIEDEGTKLFMETFHRHAQGGSYGDAWLAARNTLKQRGLPPSVYGAFILGGTR
jgi:tetratricopeptide (TPR) repeat protein